MSTVRMCDNPSCHSVFSENSEDWTTAPLAQRKKNPQTGRVEMITVQVDYCGPCSNQMTGGAGIDNMNYDKPRVPAVESHYDPRYTKQLEDDLGLGKDEKNG